MSCFGEQEGQKAERWEQEMQLAEFWEQAAQLWERLSLFLLYRRQRGKYGTHPRFGAILDQILEVEDKIYGLLKNFA